MKKKSKIILIASIIVIILIAAYVIYQSMILPRLPSRTGIIVHKGEETISLKDSVDTTEVSFLLNIEKYNPTIKDISGRKIKFSDLNIGDKIKVIYKNEKMSISVIAYPKTIKNIKLIQVIEDNSDNHMTEEDLSYNDFHVSGAIFGKDIIQFYINTVNKFPEDYRSTKCKIVKKGDNANIEDTEVKYIETTAISYRKSTEHEGEITVDVPNLRDGLEIGEYIFKFENEELGLIKIPFEINKSGSLQW